MKLFEYIRDLVRGRFFGEVRIRFQNGKIVHVEEVKSFDMEHFKE